jgi:hypothetical protein
MYNLLGFAFVNDMLLHREDHHRFPFVSLSRQHLRVNDIPSVLISIGGTGHHLAALDSYAIANALKLTTALQIVCPLTISVSKLGVLCLFHRIFAKTSTPYRIIIRVTLLLVLGVMVIQVLIPFISCRPFSKTWNPDPRYPGSCSIPGLAFYKIAYLALYESWLRRRVGVCIVGIVAAVMRFQSFLAVNNFCDITCENVKPLCWAIAESGICLVAGCMLGLKPLVKKVGKASVFERFLNGGAKSERSWGNGGLGRLRGRDERVLEEDDNLPGGGVDYIQRRERV